MSEEFIPNNPIKVQAQSGWVVLSGREVRVVDRHQIQFDRKYLDLRKVQIDIVEVVSEADLDTTAEVVQVRKDCKLPLFRCVGL